MKRFLLLPLLLVAGCAGSPWTHPTKSEAELNADSQDCRRAHSQLLQSGNANAEMTYNVRVEECMKAKGYTRTAK